MQNKVYAMLFSLVRLSKEGHLEALKQIADIGYDGVELLGNNTSGLTRTEFKKYLSDLNLDVVSTTALRTDDDFEFAADIGIRYCAIPSDPLHEHSQSETTLVKQCNAWNEYGKNVAKYGLKAVLHNHAEEFLWVDGKEGGMRIYDYYIKNTDPTYVNFQLDVGWAMRAGIKCEELIAKYPGRFALIHMKECDSVAKTVEEFEHFPKRVLELGPPKMVNGVPQFSDEQKKILDNSRRWNVKMGTGIIDFPAIVKAAEAQGCEGYISERECYFIDGVPEGDPVKCSKLDYEYMRSL
jgi:sugar phosphate isomerase/epimerase